jgi:hypothetical protein
LLFFKKDEFVYRYLKNGEWLFGSKDAKEGWFPATLVERSRPQRSEASFGSSNALMSTVSFAGSLEGEVLSAAPAAAKVATADCIKVVRATSDYTPADGKHLKLVDGDIVAVTEETDSLLTGYTLDGRMGCVPSKLVSVVHSAKPGVVLGRFPVGGSKAAGRQAPTVRTAASSKRLVEGGANSFVPFCVLMRCTGPDSTPRNKVVREIIQTEIAYGKHLDEICNLYRDSLALVPGDWKKSIPILFQNIDTIRAISQRLRASLNDMVAGWKSTTSSVAAPFLEAGPFFVAYEQYCRGFEAAQRALDSFSLDPAFVNFLKATKAELPLAALLVMPVQRMPRYKLLLADLVKHTPESHPDHKGLADAVVRQFIGLLLSSHSFLSPGNGV